MTYENIGDNPEFDSVSTEVLPNISVVHLDGRDPQTVVDAVDPYTRIVADPTNQHTLSSPLVVSTDAVQLHGLNLRLADGANDGLIEMRSDYGCVRQCRLDGNEANQDSGTAVGEYVNGITITDCSHVVIENNDVRNCRDQGILVSSLYQTANNNHDGASVSHVAVRDNTVDNVRNGAILFQGGKTGETGEVGLAVGNECTGFENEGIQFIDGWQHGVATGNHVEGTTSAFAIEQHDGRGVERAVRDIRIIGNTAQITTTGASGVAFQHTAYPFRDIIIQGNHFDVDYNGVNVGTSGADLSDMLVVANTFEGCQRGVLHSVGDFIGVYNNTFRDCAKAIRKFGGPLIKLNVVGNVVHGGDEGIVVTGAPGSIIAHNTVMGVTTKGIGVSSEASEDGNVYRIKVLGNDVDDEANGANGIEVKEKSGPNSTNTMDYYIVKNNTMATSGSYQLQEFAQGSNRIVSDNIELSN